MTNLLQETLDQLEFYNKKTTDVKFVSNGLHLGTWAQFAALADREYDAGYGHQEVAANLKVVGDDWWFERYEYDGSEHWEFKTMPDVPSNPEVLELGDLFDLMWPN